MSNDNYYDILGIDPNTSSEEIRKAYKKRALQTHPDRLPQGATQEDKRFAEEEFRRVNNAYEVLTDPNNRKAYDLHGVWPPPEDIPDKGTGSHDAFFTDPFTDPFFRSPFASMFGSHPSGNHHPYVFRDPFELFNSMFADIERDFRNFDTFPSQNRVGFFNQGPLFPTFSRGFPSPFSNPFGHMLDFPSGGSSNVQSYSYSSRGVYSNDGSGGPQWVSESRRQQTINGVTQTIIEKKDSEGNVHVRQIYPDGREKYTINGVEQSSSSPPAVQGSSSAGALPAPPTSNSLPTVQNSRVERIPVQTHSGRHRKERQDRQYEHRSSRVDRHNTNHGSSYLNSDRERAERRSKRPSHVYYEAAPPSPSHAGREERNIGLAVTDPTN